MKRIILLLLLLSIVLVGCGTPDTSSTTESSAKQTQNTTLPSSTNTIISSSGGISSSTSGKKVLQSEATAPAPTGEALDEIYTVSFKESDSKMTWEGEECTNIALSDSGITFSGNNVSVNGNVATIKAGGLYVIRGSISDGRIIVNSPDAENVRIVLNGAVISCKTSAPFYVMQADKVVMTLADGTENRFSDPSSYKYDDVENSEPSAAIFSKDDLTINGNGKLTVVASFNNGIQSKDKLKILGGTIEVSSVGDGLKGKDCVAINGGDITIKSDGDGIQSNETEAEKGFVYIESGTINIESQKDGIQGENVVQICGGNIKIKTGNGSASAVKKSGGFDQRNPWGGQTSQSSSTAESQKAIKAGVSLLVSGGDIELDSVEDTLHCNSIIEISGGNIKASAGDDGIHADGMVKITNGNINILTSYEGIESQIITLDGGDIHLKSSDDGLNGTTGGGTGTVTVTINGGYCYLDADGDGLDSNGVLNINGGTTIVNGPTNSGNGPLDFNSSCKMTGGVLIACGSSGMAQYPGTSSTQCVLALGVSTTAGQTINIKDSKGNDILTFAPSKTSQSLVFGSPILKTGETYTVSVGGSCTGTVKDGLYTDGTYSGGTTKLTVTQSSTVTANGLSGGMGGKPGGTPGGERPQRRW